MKNIVAVIKEPGWSGVGEERQVIEDGIPFDCGWVALCVVKFEFDIVGFEWVEVHADNKAAFEFCLLVGVCESMINHVGENGIEGHGILRVIHHRICMDMYCIFRIPR